MTMESEECWDKDDEPRYFMPDLSNDPKENWDDDSSLPQPFVPDIKDLNTDWENNFGDVGCQGAMNSSESTINRQDDETKSTGSPSDYQALVMGKYQHRKPKAKFSYAFEDKKVYVTNVSFKVNSDDVYLKNLMHFKLKVKLFHSFIQEQSCSQSQVTCG